MHALVAPAPRRLLHSLCRDLRWRWRRRTRWRRMADGSAPRGGGGYSVCEEATVSTRVGFNRRAATGGDQRRPHQRERVLGQLGEVGRVPHWPVKGGPRSGGVLDMQRRQAVPRLVNARRVQHDRHGAGRVSITWGLPHHHPWRSLHAHLSLEMPSRLCQLVSAALSHRELQCKYSSRVHGL